MLDISNRVEIVWNLDDRSIPPTELFPKDRYKFVDYTFNVMENLLQALKEL